MPRAGFATALVAAVMVSIVLGAAGCGGGEDSDPQDQLKTAYSPDGAGQVESGVIDATLKVDFTGSQTGGLTASLKGPFEQDGLDLTFALQGTGAAAQQADIDFRLVGTPDNGFVEYGGQAYELGAERFDRLETLFKESGGEGVTGDFKESCKKSLESTGGDAAVCDKLDPGAWLTDYADAGSEEVDGTDTDHITASLDTQAIASDIAEVVNDVAPGASGTLNLEGLADDAAGFIQEAKIDAYIDEDDVPRRTSFTLSASAFGQSLDLAFDLGLTAVGEDQEIAALPGAKPIEGLRGRLPKEIQPAVDCLLDSNSQEDLNGCFMQLAPSLPGNPLTPAA